MSEAIEPHRVENELSSFQAAPGKQYARAVSNELADFPLEMIGDYVTNFMNKHTLFKLD